MPIINLSEETKEFLYVIPIRRISYSALGLSWYVGPLTA